MSTLSCPTGQEIVSVEGGIDLCAPSPVCVDQLATGNCPGPQAGLPQGSSCGKIYTGVYGCIPNGQAASTGGSTSSEVSPSGAVTATPTTEGVVQISDATPTTEGVVQISDTTPTTASAAPTSSEIVQVSDVTEAPPAPSNGNGQAPAPTSSSAPVNTGTGSDFGPAASVNIMTKIFADLLVQQHNIIRSHHGVGAVTWNAEGAQKIQAYANTCPGFQHSSLGWENLASAPASCTSEASCKTVNPSLLWYKDEEALWNYGSNSCGTGNWADCGHYSNMISPGVKSIGCGASNCGGKSYVWCNYFSSEMNPKVARRDISSICDDGAVYGCSKTNSFSVTGTDEVVSAQAAPGVGLPVILAVVGAILVLLAVVGAVFVARRRRRQQKELGSPEEMPYVGTPNSLA